MFVMPLNFRRLGLSKLRFLFLIVVAFAACVCAFSQTDHDLYRYEDAVAKFQSQGDLGPLQQFVASAPDGFLRNDALEWLAWRQWKSGDLINAGHWSDELLANNPENALALTVLAIKSRPTESANPDRVWADEPLRMAERAIRYTASLKQPHAMSDATFAKLKQDIIHDLSGSVGDAYFQRNDYVSARPFLRNVVAVSPNDAHYIYALAIADLYGRNPDDGEGFTLLARAVNMASGSTSGEQLASFARNKYKERGGSDTDWNRYLQVTSGGQAVQVASVPSTVPVARSPAAPIRSAPSSVTSRSSTPKPSPATVASASSVPRPPTAKTSARDSSGTTSAVARPASLPPAPSPSAESRVEIAGDSNIPEDTENIDVPYPTRQPVVTTAPISLGILVETSKTSGAGRRAVVNSLSDMVRHLRDDDEAFLVTFDKNVFFEEDLTSDTRTLEKALDKIKPQQGTALLDAMTFAAGHVQRIGKNSRKVLLIISDGEDHSAQYTPSEVVSHLSSSGVEIYCIGMGANNQIDESRLKAIARRTGGEAVFINGADQFRTATREVASDMGISFQ